MSDKRYPTRMHEILGVEPGENFRIAGIIPEFWLDEDGEFTCETDEGYDELNVADVVDAINHGITRRPRLTEEQVAMLKAAWTLGARYIAREGNSGLRLSDNAPLVLMGGRLKITDDSLTMYIESYGNPLVELVKQSDPEPLDIVQTLRDNGVEVE